jgi:hypothetical protein
MVRRQPRKEDYTPGTTSVLVGGSKKVGAGSFRLSELERKAFLFHASFSRAQGHKEKIGQPFGCPPAGNLAEDKATTPYYIPHDTIFPLEYTRYGIPDRKGGPLA